MHNENVQECHLLLMTDATPNDKWEGSGGWHTGKGIRGRSTWEGGKICFFSVPLNVVPLNSLLGCSMESITSRRLPSQWMEA